GSFVLDARFGLDAGFDHYDDAVTQTPDPLSFAFPARRGAEVTDRALAWVRSTPGALFLWVHYFDVHAPRAPPPPFDQLDDPYDGELAYVDDQVGRLVRGLREARGDRPRTIVVVGDHGESLGEHGEATHGVLAYDATLHVPMIAVSHDLPADVSSNAFVRTLDVAPTLLRAAGLSPLPAARGVPLQEISAGKAPRRIDTFEALSTSFGLGWAELHGIRDERWKLTLAPEPHELFDVLADPTELDDRLDEEPGVVAELRAAYAALPNPAPTGTGSPTLSAAERGHLAVLGYSVATAPDSREGPAPDPRRFAEALAWIESARAEAARGDLARGEKLLAALSESPVLRGRALPSLAAVQRAAERFDAAIATLRAWQAEVTAPEPTLALADVLLDAGFGEAALLELEPLPESPAADELRASALRSVGRFEEAIEAAERARAADPGSDRALAELAWARAARDGSAAEIARLEPALESVDYPARWPLSRELLAELHRLTGNDRRAREVLEAQAQPPPRHRALLGALAAEQDALDAARAHYEAALERLPYVAPWRVALAGVLDRQGDYDAALALYDQLLVVSPADATYHLDRGAILARSGQPAAAALAYDRALELDPTLAEPHFNRALLHLEREDEPSAIRSLERAVELRPDYTKAHLLLARLLGAAGDPRAAEHADRALATELPE
ncbi:MAG: sulfatase-like hydrolase/transferase, partial [Myxococcales bacterium]|nr:sulfatase-like hydrolase/transferase [Myxococcales bacterium]